MTVEQIKGKRKERTRKGNEGRRKDKSNKRKIKYKCRIGFKTIQNSIGK